MRRGGKRSRGGRRGGSSAGSSRLEKKVAKRGRKKNGVTHLHNVTHSSRGRRVKARRPWEESDEERDESRPDYYSDLSESDNDDEISFKKERFDDEEAEESNFESDAETSSADYSRGSPYPTPSTCSSMEDTIACPWVDIAPENLPRFDLPRGSDDLLIDRDCLLDALEVYETCRCYFRTMQLSPFLLEDFCAALSSPKQTNILAQTHIALLKLALKDDDEEQVILSVQDTNNSFNIMLQLLEPMTYAEVLRQYLESDPLRFPRDVLEAVKGNYPFVDVKQRLKVLLWLCDRFLQSGEYRKLIKNEGKLISDEHCRECGKPGDVLLCDGCDACYHLECANLITVPDGQWFCQVCQLHEVRGVTDCTNENQRTHKQPFRLSPIGYDRHARRYWFISRRIFVQDDVSGSLIYYSTFPQLYTLLRRLDADDLERSLCLSIYNLLPLIVEQMQVTIELTTERMHASYGSNRRRAADIFSYLDDENVVHMSDIVNEDLHSLNNKVEGELLSNDGPRSFEVNKTSLLAKAKALLHVEGGKIVDTVWSAGLDADALFLRKSSMDDEKAVQSLADGVRGMNRLSKKSFRLGDDEGFRCYENQYDVNDYAKSPYQRAKERDKRKYMCGRFSLVDEGEFEWAVPKDCDIAGDCYSVAYIIQETLYRLSQKIPMTLMHRLWKRDGWERFKKACSGNVSIDILRDALLRFECALRKPVLTSVWWGTLGHTRLMRMTVEDREWRQSCEARRKKEERDLMTADVDDEDSDVVWVKYTKMDGPPRHSLWRQKDEHFRVNGRHTLGGWLWMSSSFRRTFLPLPQKPFIDISSSTSPKNFYTLATRKAYRLAGIVKKLTTWRSVQEGVKLRLARREQQSKCYSPLCRRGILPIPVDGSGPPYQGCYSSTCRKACDACEGTPTWSIVHACDPQRSFRRAKKNHSDESAEVMGEGKPFPLPVPFDFKVRRSGQQSLLVVPPSVLKRLARQGGLNPNFVPPGFHRMAKSNSTVWNYPCQRPLFDHCWRYLTLRAESLHAVALQLRIFYSCIRWADMEPDEGEDRRVTIHNPDHDETRIVIGHKEWPPDGFYEQYLLKVYMIPLDDSSEAGDQDDDNTSYTPGRSVETSRTSSRRKKSVKHRNEQNGFDMRSKAKTTEKWIDGVELKLFEISDYWKRWEQDRRKQMAPPASLPLKYSSCHASIPRDTQFSPAILGRTNLIRRSNVHSKVHDDSHVVDVELSKRLEPSKQISAENPFNPMSRIQSQYLNGNEDSRYYRDGMKEAGLLKGGGKIGYIQTEGNVHRVVIRQGDEVDSSPAAVQRPPSTASASDEPPIIPRYDDGNPEESIPSQPMSYPRSGAPQRIVYTSRSLGIPGRSVAGKVLMIRRADGTTQFLRPIFQSNTKDEQGAVHTVITTSQVGGTTMEEARNLIGSDQRLYGIDARPGMTIGNLEDNSEGTSSQPSRVVAGTRERPSVLRTNQQSSTRFVRVAKSTGTPLNNLGTQQPVRTLRLQPTLSKTPVILTDQDPFMSRMAAEKAESNAPKLIPVYQTSPSGVPAKKRTSTSRDVYAGYYGEKSNDGIDIEEYQQLAERGYRPPGRPPGRLASSFGYGPQAEQVRLGRDSLQRTGRSMKVLPLSQRTGPSAYTQYRSGVEVISSDLRPAGTPDENIAHRQGSVSLPDDGMRSGLIQNVTPKRTVMTYRDYCLSKGIDTSRSNERRIHQFNCVSNDNAGKTVASAFEKEEVGMRQEEGKGVILGRDYGTRFVGVPFGSTTLQASSSHHLTLSKSDSPIIRDCKQLIEEMISQVCKWDRQYGWFRSFIKAKPHTEASVSMRCEALRTRRSIYKEQEAELGERVDRYKKEINKRRVKLEARAEAETGISTPWRRPRGRPNKIAKRTVVTEQNATVRVPVDPSEISLNSSKESVSITPSVLEQRDVKVKSEADIVDLPSCSAAEGRGPVPKRTKFSVKIPDMLDEKPLISLASARNTCQPVLSGTELSSPGRRKRNSRKHAESSSEDESVTSIALSHSHNTRGRRKGVRHIAASETSASIKTDIKTETPPREIDPTQTHCICNKPYDPKKFYVGCDLCYRWFHGKCVSVSEKKSKKLNGWICEECSKEQKNSQQELYCVCRTPYDDSLFYVGCDGCEGWFHPSCVGITQAQAEKAAEYLCPSCAKSSQSGYESSASTASSLTPALNRADYPLLWRILEGLVAHRTSWPFREKVDTTKYPDYYSFIKKPMDLSTVQQKLENLEYQRLKDFSADITQIFVNARIYNPKDSAIYNCADILEKRFRDSLTNVKEEMDVRNRDQLRLSESRTVDSTLDIDTDQLLAMGDDVDPSVYNEILRTQR